MSETSPVRYFEKNGKTLSPKDRVSFTPDSNVIIPNFSELITIPLDFIR